LRTVAHKDTFAQSVRTELCHVVMCKQQRHTTQWMLDSHQTSTSIRQMHRCQVKHYGTSL